jgi:ribosome maturation factor RimP
VIVTDRVTAIRAELAPIVESLGLTVYDVTLTGGARSTLAVLVDRPGGVDLDALEIATRTVSAALDAMDPVHGRYLLEVSSPGLERPLRTSEHFAGAVGETVSCKARDAEGHVERIRGTLVAADAETITLAAETGDRSVPLDAVTGARTVFEWGPAPKPGRGSRPGRKKEVAARS